jgi:hypothetical protein
MHGERGGGVRARGGRPTVIRRRRRGWRCGGGGITGRAPAAVCHPRKANRPGRPTVNRWRDMPTATRWRGMPGITRGARRGCGGITGRACAAD